MVGTIGWTRDYARRAIRLAKDRTGAARDQPRRPRPRKYSYEALVVLLEVWRLSGQPCWKYFAPIMDDTLTRLTRLSELGKVVDRISDSVLAELRAMSPATIDRYLKPHRDAAYPDAVSSTKPSPSLRSSIPVRTAMDDPPTGPGFLELDTVAHCGHTLKGLFIPRAATRRLSSGSVLAVLPERDLIDALTAANISVSGPGAHWWPQTEAPPWVSHLRLLALAPTQAR